MDAEELDGPKQVAGTTGAAAGEDELGEVEMPVHGVHGAGGGRASASCLGRPSDHLLVGGRRGRLVAAAAGGTGRGLRGHGWLLFWWSLRGGWGRMCRPGRRYPHITIYGSQDLG